MGDKLRPPPCSACYFSLSPCSAALGAQILSRRCSYKTFHLKIYPGFASYWYYRSLEGFHCRQNQSALYAPRICSLSRYWVRQAQLSTAYARARLRAVISITHPLLLLVKAVAGRAVASAAKSASSENCLRLSFFLLFVFASIWQAGADGRARSSCL